MDKRSCFHFTQMLNFRHSPYIGEWYYGKTQMFDDGKKHTRKAKSKSGLGKQIARPQEDWIKVKVPAIIDRATFDLAQERIQENKNQMSGQPLKKPHLLSSTRALLQMWLHRTRQE